MGKNAKFPPNDTLIAWNKHPVGEYRKFFQQATGEEEIVTVCKDFQTRLSVFPYAVSGKVVRLYGVIFRILSSKKLNK